MAEVGDRIRRAMPSEMSQRQLAEKVGMTPDALSRALNGQRGLSPGEIARIAETLSTDTHWLITGAKDPLAVTIAARHAWDASRSERHNPGQQDDHGVLVQVADLYRAAFPHGPAPSAPLPQQASAIRELLGFDFVRKFADIVERQLGVDIIRIPGLTTDYSLRIGSRGVIVLATQAHWFRSNWSLAHELGHLALGHHSADWSSQRVQGDERSADAFAAGILAPRAELIDLAALTTEAEVAGAVWKLGISTEALRNRLTGVQLQPHPVVLAALNNTTPRLLRANLSGLDDESDFFDVVTAREQASSARRFPLGLLTALHAQTELGAASPLHLAWALDVPVDEIDFPEPDDNDDDNAYEEMLTDRPSAVHLRSMDAGSHHAQ